MSQRKIKGNVHRASEGTELDGDLSFPHTPMHAVITDPMEEQYELERRKKGLDGDRKSIALLTFLYVLQGIPLGLAGSIPYLLQSRQVNYKEQAVFSFVYWPFSVKLLWAPIVDAVYFNYIGRRKSWLVPVQYLIGIFMLVLSPYIPHLMGEDGATSVNVYTLTVLFFMLNFLAATQDIAVDGWALTMLSRRNVAWASTCNTVGQTAGYFLGNIVFLALESPDFCNNYLRSEPSSKGVVTLSQFLYFWGIVFLITTTLVFIIKKEEAASEECEQGVIETYKQLWLVVQLPAVLSLIAILLTCKVGFAAADAVTGLKLIEEGVPRDKLALLGVPMVPIQICLPFIISKYTTGPRPMDVFLKAMPFRLFMGLVFGVVVYWAPSTKVNGYYPYYFYLLILFVYGVHQIFLFTMFVSQMAFYAKVSDPVIGGTYMTLLNTITNFVKPVQRPSEISLQTELSNTQLSPITQTSTYLNFFKVHTCPKRSHFTNSLSCLLRQVTVNCTFVALMSMHARVSDPRIGGTYMTLLNTFANLGGNWPSTVALWMVDMLTWKTCLNGDGTCASHEAEKACTDGGGSCSTILDGYYVESVACVVLGFLWLGWKAKSVRSLQDLPLSRWSCNPEVGS